MVFFFSYRIGAVRRFGAESIKYRFDENETAPNRPSVTAKTLSVRVPVNYFLFF